jgi:hypothetical protein
MKSKKVLMIALLAFSFLAPLHLSSTASAESSDVLAKGDFIRPGSGGYPTETYCPPSMAAAGITLSSKLETGSFLPDLRIECIDKAMLEKGKIEYFPHTKILVTPGQNNDFIKTVFCPTGSLLSGIRASVNAWVRDIAPVCSSLTSGETTLEAKVGVISGEVLTKASICPVFDGKPTYVVGLDGSVGLGVDSVRVLCGRTLKSNSKVQFSDDSVLLAQYLPKGTLNSFSYLQPSSINPYVNFGAMTQVGGDGSSNGNVFPFRTSTTSVADWNHYFRFLVTPSSPDVIVKITKITVATLSYPIGAGPSGNQITGASARQMPLKISNSPFWNAYALSPTSTGLQNVEVNYKDLYSFSSIKEEVEVQFGFHGATGVQYNDLSGRDGATGLKIYGLLIDNTTREIEGPKAPTNLTYGINKDVVLISVDVPKSLIDSVDENNFVLTSPELGFSSLNKVMARTVKDGKAYFTFKLDEKYFGKDVTFQVLTIFDSLESAPLIKKIKIPKLTSTTPTPKPTVTPKSTPKATPKVIAPTAKSIKCSKAGVTRTFKGTTCPPGYTKK